MENWEPKKHSFRAQRKFLYHYEYVVVLWPKVKVAQWTLVTCGCISRLHYFFPNCSQHLKKSTHTTTTTKTSHSMRGREYGFETIQQGHMDRMFGVHWHKCLPYYCSCTVDMFLHDNIILHSLWPFSAFYVHISRENYLFCVFRLTAIFLTSVCFHYYTRRNYEFVRGYTGCSLSVCQSVCTSTASVETILYVELHNPDL